MQEIRVLEGTLIALGANTGKAYAGATTPWAAMEMNLNLNGDFVATKKDILTGILACDYTGDKASPARGLLNDSLNFHLRKGHLVLKDDKVGRPTNNA